MVWYHTHRELPSKSCLCYQLFFIPSLFKLTHEESYMKRITINALVDIGCLITFIPSLVSGLVLYLVLPSGGGQGSGWATVSGYCPQPMGHDAQ